MKLVEIGTEPADVGRLTAALHNATYVVPLKGATTTTLKATLGNVKLKAKLTGPPDDVAALVNVIHTALMGWPIKGEQP